MCVSVCISVSGCLRVCVSLCLSLSLCASPCHSVPLCASPCTSLSSPLSLIRCVGRKRTSAHLACMHQPERLLKVLLHNLVAEPQLGLHGKTKRGGESSKERGGGEGSECVLLLVLCLVLLQASGGGRDRFGIDSASTARSCRPLTLECVAQTAVSLQWSWFLRATCFHLPVRTLTS